MPENPAHDEPPYGFFPDERENDEPNNVLAILAGRLRSVQAARAGAELSASPHRPGGPATQPRGPIRRDFE